MGSARVIVVHPPLSISRDFIDYPYFANLGAAQLAAVLRAGGHQVALIDSFALPGAGLRWDSPSRAQLGRGASAVAGAVATALSASATVDLFVVALTPYHHPPATATCLGETLAAIADLSSAPIVLADCYQSGHHYVEAGAEAILGAFPQARAWVKYEAEVTVAELAARLADGDDIDAGVHHGTRADLAELPLPAWDLIDVDNYASFHADVVAKLERVWPFPIDGRTLPLMTARGCPYDCIHCSSNPDRIRGGGKNQRRSPHVDRNVAALVEDFGATRIAILDDLANADHRHFDSVVGAFTGRDTGCEFPNGLRADRLRRSDIEALRGRITTLSISAESGSQRVIDEIVGKRLELATVDRVAAWAQTLSIPLIVHYLIGLPGESPAEINQTLEHAVAMKERYAATPALQYATPLPGTRLGAHAPVAEVGDWGPRFQNRPSAIPAAAAPATLAEFKWAFEQRTRAGAGPEKLILNLTYRCNNHCVFCAVGNRCAVDGDRNRQRGHLRDYRARGVRMVDFDGGEPTLHPALIPLIGYARRLGYERIAVTTNGRLCFYPDFADRLVDSGLTTLLFSLHGPDPATHTRHVDVPEAFEQTVAGIENCVASAPDNVELGLNVTVTRYNYRRLADLADLALSLGLGWLNLQFLTPFGRATVALAPALDAAAERTRRLIDHYGDRLHIQVINLPFCFMPGYSRYLAGDLGKLARHMVFVDDTAVNLANYLADRRVRTEQCASCAHAIFCAGFYELVVVPELPWGSGASSSKP